MWLIYLKSTHIEILKQEELHTIPMVMQSYENNGLREACQAGWYKLGTVV